MVQTVSIPSGNTENQCREKTQFTFIKKKKRKTNKNSKLKTKGMKTNSIGAIGCAKSGKFDFDSFFSVQKIRMSFKKNVKSIVEHENTQTQCLFVQFRVYSMNDNRTKIVCEWNRFLFSKTKNGKIWCKIFELNFERSTIRTHAIDSNAFLFVIYLLWFGLI